MHHQEKYNKIPNNISIIRVYQTDVIQSSLCAVLYQISKLTKKKGKKIERTNLVRKRDKNIPYKFDTLHTAAHIRSESS